MTSTSRRCTGAACRWAAWSDRWLGANAPDRFDRIILSNTACHYPDPTNWLNPHQGGEGRRHRVGGRRRHRERLTTDFREREPADSGEHKAMLVASPVQGYLACLRGSEHARPARAFAQDQEPDAGDRGTMSTPVAAGEFIPQPDTGASLTLPRRRAYFPMSNNRTPSPTAVIRLPDGNADVSENRPNHIKHCGRHQRQNSFARRTTRSSNT